MEFKEIKAKVCPNAECKQVIPEDWTASFQLNMCPKCGYGYDETKAKEWRKQNGY